MPADLPSLLVLVLTCVATFALSRFLSRKWRAKRREREERDRRVGETRQVRRARERRGGK